MLPKNWVPREEWLAKLPKKVMSACMLIKNDEGKVLMVKASYKDYWTPPGGIVDEGYSPKAVAEKEVMEEIGISIAAKKLVTVMYRSKERDIPEKVFWFFDGGVLRGDLLSKIKPDGDEILEYKFMSRDEVFINTSDWGERWKTIFAVWESGQTKYFDNDERL